MSVADPAENLAAVAQETDKAVRQARERLVTAVRKASRDGMSQKEIARQIGRSQPEVSRLLRFHGTTPLARRLRSARHEVIETVKAAGGSNVRVFGSVATGREHEGSDIDLLFHMDQPLGLMDLAGWRWSWDRCSTPTSIWCPTPISVRRCASESSPRRSRYEPRQ